MFISITSQLENLNINGEIVGNLVIMRQTFLECTTGLQPKVQERAPLDFYASCATHLLNSSLRALVRSLIYVASSIDK